MSTSETGFSAHREPLEARRAGLNRGLTWVMEAGLWLLLVATPLALGSVSERAALSMEAVCFLLLLLAKGGGAPRGLPRFPRWIGAVSLLFVGWTLYQLIPLPPRFLKIINPETHALYVRYLPGYASGKPEDLQGWLLFRREGRSGSLTPRPGHLTGMENRLEIHPGWKPISWYPALTLRWTFRFLAYFSLFVLVVRYLPEKAYRKRLPGALLILGSAISLFGIIQHLTWNGKIYWVIPVYRGGPFGPWVNSSNFSGYLEMVLPIGAAVLLQIVGKGGSRGRRHSRRSRVPLATLIGFLLFFMVAAILMAHSRGGLFSILLTAAVFFLLQVARAPGGGMRRWPFVVAGALPLLALGIGITWYILHPTLADPNMPGDIEASFGARLLAWEGVLKMVASNPLTGTGLGTFSLAYPVFKTYGLIQNWPQAHNDYLQILAESGAIGFALFLMGLFLFLRRFVVPALSQPWRTRDPLILGSALGTATLLIHSLVEFNLQIPSNGLLFVLVAGLLVRSQLEEPESSAAGGSRAPKARDLLKPFA